MTVMRTYKYKFYHSKRNNHLDHQIEIAAEVWNYCVAMERRYYRLYKKYLPANRLKTHITKVKHREKYMHWKQLGSQAIQDVVERMNRSYQAFFDHVAQKRGGRKSPPKFCKRKNYHSFTLKQAGYKFHDSNRITIMGREYKYVAHRPMEGTVKTLTVKCTTHGYIYLFVVCEQPEYQTLPRTGHAVGLDFGFKAFLTTDNGAKITSPEWYRHDLARVRAASRKITRCQKGSNNRRRAVCELSRLHAEIKDRRRDWFYKLAHELTGQYATISIEDLNLKAMQKVWGRKINDYAFAEFVDFLKWVAYKNGSTVVAVDRWAPTTKKCHACGAVLPETIPLDVREWTCPCCGTTHDRDINAAINIKNQGLAVLACLCPLLRPVRLAPPARSLTHNLRNLRRFLKKPRNSGEYVKYSLEITQSGENMKNPDRNHSQV